MKKLALRLEDLRIDSFVTERGQETRGTVHGAEPSVWPRCVPPEHTFLESCGGSCFVTCFGSCEGSCDGEPCSMGTCMWEETCAHECEPTQRR